MGNFRHSGLLRRLTPNPRAAAWLVAAALAPIPAQAQQSDTDSARTQVSIQEPGSIANVQDMHFGQIIQPGAAGTVVLAPAATSTCTTTGGLVHTGQCRAAEFSIYGGQNWNARLRTVSNTVILNGPGGATMTMDTITFAYLDMSPTSGANGWNLGRYTIDSGSGIATIWLGGTLHVNPIQALGAYSGTLVVEVEFN